MKPGQPSSAGRYPALRRCPPAAGLRISAFLDTQFGTAVTQLNSLPVG